MTYTDLAQGIESITPANGLKEKLELAKKENRPLIIKFGMDPTAPDLHLGHAVGLKKIRQFLDAGHEIHLIVGNFTALVGDPSGRNSTRPPLTPEEVQRNAETYVSQLSKIFDTSKIHIHYNNDWLGQMSFADVLKLLSKATLSQMMQREDFRNRYENNVPVALHELIYPLIQGYDSVAIKSDIEFGGRDQLLNCLFGKSLQESLGMDGQIVLTMPLLCGMDGHIKMSKSKGNYIGLTEHPNDMYGKTMSIPDFLIPEWVELTTDWTPAEKADAVADFKNGTTNPMEIKKKIAFNIVKQYHSEADAIAAEAFFYKQVQQKGFDTKEFKAVLWADVAPTGSIGLVDLGAKLLEQSKSNIRRLIEGGAVSINGEKTGDINLTLSNDGSEIQLKLGKRGFFTLK
ncbi:MAG: tyrosine--tRNA ligase [Alphaproteobacteria bacterium]|nr:tyrosine--tRNA ligase [Alphaproteobacteria bacterium]